ncbi:MAG TPA: hypothetical protein ENJ61_00370 [Aquifex aeolicus]|uniref:Uncharacterized protein n=1 Tax=Aquifex aeolicus TaxID=63363 RepID=A0A7C5QJY3_AQUAO|nr:hypothetical protein [Aquifex aeolicus]
MLELAGDVARNPERYAGELKEILGKVDSFDDTEIRDFVVVEEIRQTEDVDIGSVVGTAHPDYQGLYWSEMLLKGKRMHLNLPLLEKNPSYYLDGERKLPVMEYLELEGKVYVYGDGNHRTAIAKVFLGLLGKERFGKVYLRKWTPDEKALELAEAAKDRGVSFFVKRVKLSREDGPGWQVEHYDLRFLTEKGEMGAGEFERYLKEKGGFLTKIFAFLGGS